MTRDEKLALLEKVLGVEPNTLREDTLLEDVPQWDSLNILSLQIELTVIQPDMTFEQLHQCESIGEVCMLF